MTESIFEFDHYKDYLRVWSRGRGRGANSMLAKGAGCQLAYVSQVLNHDADLSLEQAEGIAREVGLEEEETAFLLLLVQKERAATASLKERFARDIERKREKRLLLKNRVKVRNTLNQRDRFRYYSCWYYAAVHILLGIPEFRTKKAIASRLKIPEKKVQSILRFLLECGLIHQEQTEYRPSNNQIHLPGDSVMISNHHTNCRFLAVRAAELGDEKNLHYSSIITLSKEDVQKIKSILIKAIQEGKETVRKSRDQVLYGFNVDFFEVGG